MVLLYSKTSDATQINKARQELFLKGTRSFPELWYNMSAERYFKLAMYGDRH